MAFIFSHDRKYYRKAKNNIIAHHMHMADNTLKWIFLSSLDLFCFCFLDEAKNEVLFWRSANLVERYLSQINLTIKYKHQKGKV